MLFVLIDININKVSVKNSVSYLCSNLQQRSPTLLFYSLKDHFFMEKTPLSSIHNFFKKCAGAPLMITCESHCHPTIQPSEHSQMLNLPPLVSCTYNHLAIYSVKFIKKLIMIICPYFFAKYTIKTIYLPVVFHFFPFRFDHVTIGNFHQTHQSLYLT